MRPCSDAPPCHGCILCYAAFTWGSFPCTPLDLTPFLHLAVLSVPNKCQTMAHLSHCNLPSPSPGNLKRTTSRDCFPATSVSPRLEGDRGGSPVHTSGPQSTDSSCCQCSFCYLDLPLPCCPQDRLGAQHRMVGQGA